MFSKNNTYLLQQQADPPNSLHSRASASLVGLNGSEIFLSHHHHHPDILSSCHYAPPVVESAVLYNQDAGHHHHHHHRRDPSSATATVAAPKLMPAKKDRHSKIHTAQGPRDRRVRLSIGVARKFFDLQEMLGFDKPSKTLDWLLTKSRTAIKHLVHTKQQGSKSTVISSLSECDDENNNYTEEVESFSDKSSRKKGKSTVNSNKKNKGPPPPKDAHHEAALNLAKESRVKARARARERTREKMCIKQQQQQQINGGYELNLPCSIPYMNNQLEICKISSSGSGIIHCQPQGYHHHEAASSQDDLIQESIVIKRKVKHPSIFDYNATENNWDISNYASQSSICAILDQHKFNINSSSNN